MDQELIAYLDMRFRETSQQISEEISSLRQDTTQQIASLRQDTTQQIASLRQDTTQQLTSLRQDTTQQIASLRDETTLQIGSLRDETTLQIGSLRDETIQRFEHVDERLQELKDTGRHTQVMVEDLRRQIQQVAEGVAGANQRLDSFKIEARTELAEVRSFFTTHNKNLEGRVQILEAKAARPRRSASRPT